jgi:hypothetical protein
MNFAPHKLFVVVALPPQVDENGDPVPNTGSNETVYLCDCYLHDAGVQLREGYRGMGISVTSYVNMDKRDDLVVNLDVVITEQDGTTIRTGQIVDIKHSYGMKYAGASDYTTIYI